MDVKLRLVQFAVGSRRRVGVELGDGGSVVDVTCVYPNIPRDMRSFLEQWDTSLTLAARCGGTARCKEVVCLPYS